jgi:hypothetical protein
MRYCERPGRELRRPLIAEARQGPQHLHEELLQRIFLVGRWHKAAHQAAQARGAPLQHHLLGDGIPALRSSERVLVDLHRAQRYMQEVGERIRGRSGVESGGGPKTSNRSQVTDVARDAVRLSQPDR